MQQTGGITGKGNTEKINEFGCGMVERLGSKAGPFQLEVWREGWREGSMRRNYPADTGADKS